MPTREELIRIIEQLYPIDAEYEDTAMIGRELLSEAKEECNDWRNEPLNVLAAYARRCQERHQKDCQH
jgi:hypothetical protein